VQFVAGDIDIFPVCQVSPIASCSDQGGIVCERYNICQGKILDANDTNRCCRGSCGLPSSFDWRNRHGENWNSPVKDQGMVSSCTTFGGIASIEAAINLFYNQHLNIDLSEQSILSCGKELYGLNSSDIDINRCFNINSPASCICNAKFAGIVDEGCYPYVDHITPDTYVCNNLCTDYENNFWKVANFKQLLSSEYFRDWVLDENNELIDDPSHPLLARLNQERLNQEKLMESIIKYGPVAASTVSPGHTAAIVGWKKTNDGETQWIWKDSSGVNYGENGYSGAVKSATSFGVVGVVITPIIPPLNQNYEIKCVDKDNDGFCNWGISENKPSTCPETCNSEKDWDDSNSSIGALGIGIIVTETVNQNNCPIDGTLIKLPSGSKIYVVKSCKKHWVKNTNEFQKEGYIWANVKIITAEAMNFLPEVFENSQDIKEGSIIRAKDGIDVYIIKYIGNKKFIRLILNPSVFRSYGHLKWEDVIEVEREVIDSFVISSLVRSTETGRIYRLDANGDNGIRRHFRSIGVMQRSGYDLDAVYEINEADENSYERGEDLE